LIDHPHGLKAVYAVLLSSKARDKIHCFRKAAADLNDPAVLEFGCSTILAILMCGCGIMTKALKCGLRLSRMVKVRGNVRVFPSVKLLVSSTEQLTMSMRSAFYTALSKLKCWVIGGNRVKVESRVHCSEEEFTRSTSILQLTQASRRRPHVA